MRIISCYTHKGGVGKSTVSAALAYGFYRIGEKTLLVNADGQNDSIKFIAGDKKKDLNQHEYSLIDMIQTYKSKHKISLEKAVFNLYTEQGNGSSLDVIMSEDIEDICTNLQSYPEIKTAMETVFLDAKNLGYDNIIFDCGPTDSKLNTAILNYAGMIIAPVELKMAAVEGLIFLYNYLDKITVDRDKVKLVIANNLKIGHLESEAALKALKNKYKDTPNILFEQPIKDKASISKAAAFGIPIFDFNPEDGIVFLDLLKKVVKNYEL